MNKNLNDLIVKIIKLNEFNNGNIRKNSDVFVNFDWVDERDGANLKINTESGLVILESWDISYHNGDPYAFKSKELSTEESVNVLGKLLSQLKERAKQKAIKNILQERENEVIKLAEKQVLAILNEDPEKPTAARKQPVTVVYLPANCTCGAFVATVPSDQTDQIMHHAKGCPVNFPGGVVTIPHQQTAPTGLVRPSVAGENAGGDGDG